jgi:Fic family protein
MDSFENTFRMSSTGTAGQIARIAIAHHRFNYIHPFPDGNGRVSRLMSHAMALRAGLARTDCGRSRAVSRAAYPGVPATSR